MPPRIDAAIWVQRRVASATASIAYVRSALLRLASAEATAAMATLWSVPSRRKSSEADVNKRRRCAWPKR